MLSGQYKNIVFDTDSGGNVVFQNCKNFEKSRKFLEKHQGSAEVLSISP